MNFTPMVHANIFKHRNDWAIITLRCKRLGKNESDTIRFEVTKEFGYDPFLQTEARQRDRVTARHVYLTLCYQYSPLSQDEVGAKLGKDRCTVIHSVKAMQDRLDTDNAFKEKYNRIDRTIKRKLKT